MKDDVISRQAAIDALPKPKICDYMDEFGAGYSSCAYDAESAIESIPAIDVVPVVHAYWRDTGSGQECSACKEIQYGYDTGRYFCANCGAKMDGERKE